MVHLRGSVRVGLWSKVLEDRAEAFNLTNTTFFGAAFGTITSAGDPRVIQLAVKFVF